MASTDTTAVRLHALTADHLAGALALTRFAEWNQVEADWRHVLEVGQGWGLSTPEGLLVATTAVLPYPPDIGWISFVLVHPLHRQRGHATRLLQVAIDHLHGAGLTPMLDATPAGRRIYAAVGFRDCGEIVRLYADAGALRLTGDGAPDPRVQPLAAEDWPRLLAGDTAAFGAQRDGLLASLAQRLPAAALAAGADGQPAGFLLGRDGHAATQLGPLCAESDDAARALLQAALPRLAGPVVLDVGERHQALLTWLLSCGFAVQRRFTRMALGAAEAGGDARRRVLMAGPEFG